MILPIDETLRSEARRFRFRFSCGFCAQFDSDTELCSLGFPAAPHLQESLDDRTEIIFCKAFELQ